jgi:hypothetical protein
VGTLLRDERCAHEKGADRNVALTARKLIASHEQTLEMLEHSIAAIRTLVDAHEAGQRPSPQTLADYRAQCARVERSIVDLRALLATFKAEFRVH